MNQNNNIKCEGDVCEIGDNDSQQTTNLLDLEVSEWLNTNGKDIKLSDLKGKVVIIDVFQMLCPGCIIHSLPQANRLHSIFRDEERVIILGLHSVFEHHSVMQKESLKVFLSEFRYTFPVGIDKYEDGQTLPTTMRKFNLKGTPSLIIIDKEGNISETLFGVVDDLILGLKIGQLLSK